MIRFFYGVGVILVLVAVATGVMGTPRLQAQVRSVRSTRDVISRLENEVPGLMKQGGVPGMSIALIRDGKTIWLMGSESKTRRRENPSGRTRSLKPLP